MKAKCKSISEHHKTQANEGKAICDLWKKEIEKVLPKAKTGFGKEASYGSGIKTQSWGYVTKIIRMRA